jgi:hypothetical protein
LNDAIVVVIVLGGATMPASQINPGDRGRRDALHKALEAEGKRLA